MKIAFYKGARPGLPGLYNRFVRWWSHGPYSHCELIFSDGVAASSSFMDGGVRFKEIYFEPAKWDVVDLPASLEYSAREWFVTHIGQSYDLLGNLHFLCGPVTDDKQKWFCSEAIAAALGIPQPWRYDPCSLASTITIFNPITRLAAG